MTGKIDCITGPHGLWYAWNNLASNYYLTTDEKRFYERLVLFVGARLLILFGGELHMNDTFVGAFIEAGPEMSFDSERIDPPGTSNDQKIEVTTFGAAIGGGYCAHVLVENHFWLLFSLGFRYHIILDSFLSMSVINFGVRFGI